MAIITSFQPSLYTRVAWNASVQSARPVLIDHKVLLFKKKSEEMKLYNGWDQEN